MRKFMRFREAAVILDTDYSGLRQSFETGLAKTLPAYVYCGDKPFLARLTGYKAESKSEHGTLDLLVSRTGPPIGWSFILGDIEGMIEPSALGDEFCDVSEVDYTDRDGHSNPFELRGFLRVDSTEMKDAARVAHLGMARVAPKKWWDGQSIMPRDSDGTPTHFFMLLATNNSHFRELPLLDDLWFHVDDIAQLKNPAPRQQENPAHEAIEKPLDERERSTLLCVIGALSKELKLDLSQPMKAGDIVEAMAPELKWKGRSIGEHLKKVADAMENRKK